MSRTDKKSKRKVSCNSTEPESSQERDESCPDSKSIQKKYKTQLCKNFQAQGKCPYGPRCRFAHGLHEIVAMDLPDCFRKKKCKGFWEQGFCPYGSRCQFAHKESPGWDKFYFRCSLCWRIGAIDFISSSVEVIFETLYLGRQICKQDAWKVFMSRF